MNVKKFFANTSREALRKVRDALGPDAVILSNRSTEGGVEILALASEDISSLAPSAEEEMLLQPEISNFAAKIKRRESVEQDAAAGDAYEPLRKPSTEDDWMAEQMREQEREPKREPNREHKRVQQWTPEPEVVMQPAKEHEKNKGKKVIPSELDEVMNEIRAMRGMMESQLAEISWGGMQKREPHKAVVLREMLAAGFSPSLARYLTEKMPATENPEAALDWMKAILCRNLTTMNNENEVLEKGGVFALVGPTGVGKTTSTAKLAARCVMRHGTEKLALITTDGYRIGGHEQLRIYGKILGVMVHSVRDESDLRIALTELRSKHTVLIDTVGVSQRDQMVAEQVAMLSGAGSNVKRLLCLSATSTGETLNEVVRAYQGSGLAGCIMTKLDEAATIGNALDVIIRQKLNLYYISNGQRVPEDLHLANQLYLIDRAFKLKRETMPFELKDSELPLVMGNATGAMHDKALREVNLG